MGKISINKTKKQPNQTFWTRRLNTKLLLWFLIAALLPVLVVGFLSINASRNALLNITLRDARVDTRVFGKLVSTELEKLGQVVIDLSESTALTDVVRARPNEEIDPAEETSESDPLDRLANTFEAIAKEVFEEEEFAKYRQFQFIDVDGQEVVRINVDEDGEAERVEDEELQSVADQDYFDGTTKKDPGELFLSQIELNREGNPPVLTEPNQPVIRYGTPVADAEGVRQGIIVVTADPEFFLEHLFPDNFGPVDLAAIEELKLLIDSDGYYLVHANDRFRWGGPRDLNTRVNIKTEFPEIATYIFNDIQTKKNQEEFNAQFKEQVTEGQPSSTGIIKLFDDFAVHYRPIFPDPENENRYWISIQFLPGRLVLGPVRGLQNLLFGLTAIFAGAVTILSYLAARSISRPVTTLQEGVKIIEGGNLSHQVTVTTQDEIGQLGHAFNQMTMKLKDIYDHLEQKVRERTSELRKFQQAVESSTDGVIMMTQPGVIAYGNPAWQKQTGYALSAVLGTALDKIVSDKTPADVRAKLRRHLQRGQPFLSEEIFIRRQDGREYQIQLSIDPIREAGQVRFLVALQQDITLRKEIDRAKTEFVSLASHQLRSPLSTINWYAEMLLTGEAGKITGLQRQYLKEIYGGNHRMAKLVSDLLNVSRLELGTFVVEPQPTDIKPIIRESIADLTAMVRKKRLHVKIQQDQAIKRLSLDPKLFGLIIQNLVSNAVKYTPDRGSVSIKTSLVRKGDKLAGRSVNVEGVAIEVSDTGYGIPIAQQASIFSKLFRADNARAKVSEGTGLGLYMVKSIVDRCHGHISFTSVENKGTTFVVVLPLNGTKKSQPAGA